MEIENLNIRELKCLYSISLHLNSVVDLNTALMLVLKETIKALDMNTGWIWLLHPKTNSVFLAASHNLPKAFKERPERLSGWCYCIEKYLENDMPTAQNISEVTCSRLKDINAGTNGLKYHATLPLYEKEKKIGLLNIVSENSGQLTDQQLNLLRHIGLLLSATMERTSIFEKSKDAGIFEERSRLAQKFKSNIISKIEELEKMINSFSLGNDELEKENLDQLKSISTQIKTLSNQNLSDLKVIQKSGSIDSKIKYPSTPLTKREMEVLNLIKEGKTNKIIASDLYISERTVKFHVSILLSKLDAKNRTDAVQIAVKRGLVSIE